MRLFAVGMSSGVMALAVLCAFSGVSRADCSIADETATCTGDPGTISYTDGSVTDVVIKELTADITTSGTAVELTDTAAGGSGYGDAGGDSVALTVGAVLETDYSIQGATYGIYTVSTAGAGHDGKSESTSAFDITGDNGGSGGTGGDVKVTVTHTPGALFGGDDAIYAVSTGGDGGAGGEGRSHLGQGTGGDAGDGGAAGTAYVFVDANVSIEGGIYAASEGGTGGTGGEGHGTTNGLTKSSGSGGAAGTVELVIEHNAQIADDIELTSTGGTGGTGGYGLAGDKGEGGTGGTGGTGADATLTMSYDVVVGTMGSGSTEPQNGVSVISQGGAGGTGGKGESNGEGKGEGGTGGTGGEAGDVTVTATDGSVTITTDGNGSYGLLAESIGGAGGTGGESEATSGDGNGSTGGVGGTGGKVEVNVDVTISAQGELPTTFGVKAGSYGGNGGDAGTIDAKNSYYGDGGNGGDAGTVTLAVTGTIHALGDYPRGIWAESIGGSGGASSATAGTDGDGSDVSASTGSVTAVGISAYGVYAASAGANSGKVSVEVGGDTTVDGENAVAVYAKSLSAGASGDSAGNVTVDVTGGNVTATGSGSQAILAQSYGGEGTSGSIAITIGDGYTVEGADDGTATVSLLDGTGNTLTNSGTLLGPSDSDSVYVVYTALSSGSSTGGDLAIVNYGTMTGSLDLGASATNSLNNFIGATLNLGPVVNLGSSGTLTNQGTMSPGGEGTVATSTITGVVVSQASEGTYWTDLEMGSSPSADQLVLDVHDASFEGKVTPNVVSYDASGGSSGSFTIISATGPVYISDLSVADSSTVTYALSGDGTDKVTLAYSIDATGGSSADLGSSNRRATGAYLNTLMKLGAADAVAGGNHYAFLNKIMTAFLNAKSDDELKQLLDEYTAEEAVLDVPGLQQAMLNFHDQIRSCPAINQDGWANFNREGECSWVRFTGGTVKQNDTTDRIGYRENAWSVTGGEQRRLGNGWGDALFLGLAGSYVGSKANGSGFSSNEDFYQVGSVLKQEIGDTTLSGSVALGYFDRTIDRSVTTSGGTEAATGKPTGFVLSGEARAQHAFAMQGGWYTKPIVALTAAQIWQRSFTESGAGAANMTVASANDFSLVLEPQLEVGHDVGLFEPSTRAYVRVGASEFLTNPNTDASMRFASAPSDSPWLTLTSQSDRLYGHLAVGLDAKLADNLTLSLIGENSVSANTVGFDGSAKLRLSF